jgi:hypothetical protein
MLKTHVCFVSNHNYTYNFILKSSDDGILQLNLRGIWTCPPCGTASIFHIESVSFLILKDLKTPLQLDPLERTNLNH